MFLCACGKLTPVIITTACHCTDPLFFLICWPVDVFCLIHLLLFYQTLIGFPFNHLFSRTFGFFFRIQIEVGAIRSTCFDAEKAESG